MADHLSCGCSSVAEREPSKLKTRVRFPIPAPPISAQAERLNSFLNAEHESVFVQWLVFWLKCWWLVALTGGQFLVLIVGLGWRMMPNTLSDLSRLTS